MRWFDWYLVLLAAVSLVGISVSWAAGATPWVQAAFLVALVGFLALAAWSAVHATKVVIVGRRRGRRLVALENALDDAGFAPRLCPGPAQRPCPVLEGHTCPVGGHPAAAVIYVPAGQGCPLPPCGRGLDVPVLAVAEDAGWAPEADERAEHLPWSRGAGAVAAAVTTILSARRRGAT
jgi:hypothetical protein